MNHPFLSHRKDVTSARRGIQLATDVAVIANACNGDLACISERRDPHVTDPDVLMAVIRNASRLGLAIDDLGEICTSLSIENSKGLIALRESWINCISRGIPMDVFAVRKEESRLISELNGVLKVHEGFEHDEGSSSASDYSDSHTESTRDSEEEEESTDEEEESGE